MFPWQGQPGQNAEGGGCSYGLCPSPCEKREIVFNISDVFGQDSMADPGCDVHDFFGSATQDFELVPLTDCLFCFLLT